MRDGKTDSPDLPEKIEPVNDGTSRAPTVNVMRIITEWTLYKSWSSNPNPGGSVWMYWLRNFSHTKINAFAITSMKEYWMKAFSQPQKIHSSVGTMKNGTNKGPTKAHTAVAIMLKEMTNRSANCARPIKMSIVQ